MGTVLVPVFITGAAAGVAYYVWQKVNAVPDPPKVTDKRHSAISIPNAGGFDRLCHTNAPFGVIGANIPSISPGILPQHISEYGSDVNADLVMVEVHAFGLNYADCCIRWGLYSSAKKFVGWPITPGFEFSGKVCWVGNAQSNQFKIGDEVFGMSMFGAYSTSIIVPGHQLFHKPSNMSMSAAAGFFATAMTAYYALFELAAPTAIPYIGQHIMDHTNAFYKKQQDSKENEIQCPKRCVLIHSASGGVGSMLAQFCRIAGIECVVGIVGGQHKIAMAKEMGCTIVIDRKSNKLRNGNIWDEIKQKVSGFDGFDIIFDANGVATLQKSYHHLKATGKLIPYGFHTMLPHTGSIGVLDWLKIGVNALRTPSFNPMKMVSDNKAVMGFNLSFLFARTDILEIGIANMMPWIESEQIKVSKVTEYKMENVADAHRDIQSGKTIGKLVMITPHHSDYGK